MAPFGSDTQTAISEHMYRPDLHDGRHRQDDAGALRFPAASTASSRSTPAADVPNTDFPSVLVALSYRFH